MCDFTVSGCATLLGFLFVLLLLLLFLLHHLLLCFVFRHVIVAGIKGDGKNRTIGSLQWLTLREIKLQTIDNVFTFFFFFLILAFSRDLQHGNPHQQHSVGYAAASRKPLYGSPLLCCHKPFFLNNEISQCNQGEGLPSECLCFMFLPY